MRASQLESSPHSLQLEKALHAAMKTHPQPKIKTKTNRKPQNFPCLLVHNYIVLSSIRLFATLWTVDRQASLSTGFSRQEYWSGLAFPSPGDLPNPAIEHVSLVSPALAGGFFKTVPPGKPTIHLTRSIENSQAYRSRQ